MAFAICDKVVVVLLFHINLVIYFAFVVLGIEPSTSAMNGVLLSCLGCSLNSHPSCLSPPKCWVYRCGSSYPVLSVFTRSLLEPGSLLRPLEGTNSALSSRPTWGIEVDRLPLEVLTSAQSRHLTPVILAQVS